MPLENINMQTGAAQQASAFADRLEGFKRESLGRLSQASAQRGQQEGTQAAAEYVEKKKAGEEAELEFRNNFGVSGQAYNKALGTAYKASVKSDLSAGLNALAVEYPDDIATYNDMSQDLIKSTIQGADSSLQDELYLDSELINTQYQKQVQGNSIRKNLADAEKQLQNSKAVQSDAMLRGVQQARTPEEYQNAALLAEDLLFTMQTELDAGIITEGEFQAQQIEISKGFAEQSYMNKIDDALKVSPEAAFDELDKIKETPAGWSPKDWDSFLTSARTKINREVAAKGAKTSADLSKIKDDLKTHRQQTTNGEITNQADLKRLQREASQYPELTEYFTDTLELGAFSVQDSSARALQVNQTNDGTFEGYRDSQRLAQQNDVITKKYQADGYSFGVAQGMIDEIPLSSENGFYARGEQARQLSIHSGVEVSPVTQAELAGLSAQVSQGSYQDQLELIATINTMSFGKEKLYGQLAGKNNAVFAVVGSSGDESLAIDALMGLDKIKNGLVKKPKSSDYLPAFNDYMGNALGANDSAATLETAMAVYAQAYGTESFDAGNFEEVLGRIVGGIGSKNGSKYILPSFDGLQISEGDFENNMYYFNESGYQALGGANGYTFDQFKEQLSEGQLVGVGKNEYYIKDSVTGGVIMSAQDPSKPFVYSYNPEWRNHVPSVNTNDAMMQGYKYVP